MYAMSIMHAIALLTFSLCLMFFTYLLHAACVKIFMLANLLKHTLIIKVSLYMILILTQ